MTRFQRGDLVRIADATAEGAPVEGTVLAEDGISLIGSIPCAWVDESSSPRIERQWVQPERLTLLVRDGQEVPS